MAGSDSNTSTSSNRSNRAEICETRKALTNLTVNYNKLQAEFIKLHTMYTTLKNACDTADSDSPQSPVAQILEFSDDENDSTLVDENDSTLVENLEYTKVSRKSKSPKKATGGDQLPLPSTTRRKPYSTRSKQYAPPSNTSTNRNEASSSGNTIPTNNRFDPLLKDKNSSSANDGVSPPTKTAKPPPLIIPGLTSTSVRAHISTAGVNSAVETKNTQEGVKVFVQSKDEYKTFAQHLKSASINYFSHPFIEEKTTKFIVTGLCKANYDEIVPELNDLGFFPTKITEINLENKRWEDDGTFIVYFTNSNPATLTRLQKDAKTLCYTRVTWKDFVPGNRQKHTQCRNCQRHGHGSSFCFLKPACMYCGEEHVTIDCANKTGQSKFKCALCNENHTANDPLCNFRLSYLKNTSRARLARTKQGTNVPPQSNIRRFIPAPAPPPLTASFAAVSREIQKNKTQTSQPFTPSAPEAQRQRNIPACEDLLTPIQVSELLSNAIPRLMTARSAAEQMTIILTICTEYVAQK